MTESAGCPFCEIVRGADRDVREVYRDGAAVAFFPPEPATLGHTLLVPSRHIPDVWSLDEQTAEHLARLTVGLSRAVKRATSPEGLNIIQSNGKAATQTVFHLHVHIVPRWSNDALGPIWPSETTYSEEQKDEVWDRVRRQCRQVGEK
jgi:histidine triad (HIT) family protein